MSFLFTLIAALLLGTGDVITFNEVTHDFGSQPKSVNVLSHDFVFTNVSSKPVSISYAVSTCSCTKLKWTKTKVAPGETGFVRADYYREQTRNSFEKFISVFVDGVTKPYVLRIAGSFYDTQSSLEASYPVRRGNLGLTQDVIDLGTVHPGDEFNGRIWLANLTDQDLDINFDKLSDNLLVDVPRYKIFATTEMDASYTLTIDSLVWGERFYYATPVVDGKAQDPIKFKVLVLDNFDNLSYDEIKAGPYPVIEGGPCSFGTVKRGRSVSGSFEILNKSDQPLQIKRLYSDNGGVSLKGPSVIGPNKTAQFKYNISSSALKPGANTIVVNIVSNSPRTPLRKVMVSGKVE